MSENLIREDELAARIDPWLAHMRWRADFDDWRAKRIWQENYQALHVGELKTYAPNLANARVLDLGAGMGGFGVALARDAHANVIASDLNPAYSEITRLRARRYALDLPALTSVGEAIPFADASFDIVTAWDVLEHVQNPRALIREGARVLKPHGLFFLTAINRFAFRDPHYHLPFVNYLPRALAEKIIERRGRSKTNFAFQDRQRLSEMHYFTTGQVRRLLTEYGFGKIMDLRAKRAQRAAREKSHSTPALLKRLHLLDLAYSIYRLGIASTWEFVAQKI